MAFTPSPELTAYVAKLLPRYPQKRSGIMMILHHLQREDGRISLEAQEWVAGQLDITPMQVREVVTFYPYYREHEIGKRHIRVCRTLSCALRGSYRLADQLCEAFETKLDAKSPCGRVTVEFAECLASCGSAPVALVDNDLHEYLEEAETVKLIEKIRAETPAGPTPEHA